MEPQFIAHADRMIGVVTATLLSLDPTADQLHDPAAALATFRDAISADMAAEHPLVYPDVALSARYELSVAELAILWLAVAPHLDPDLTELVARANDNVLRHWIDPAICMRAFCASRADKARMQGVFASHGALLASGLLQLQERDRQRSNPAYHELVPAPQLAPTLCGVRAVAPAAAPYASHVTPNVELANLIRTGAAHEFRTLLNHFLTRSPLHVVARHDPTGLGYPAGIAVLALGPRGSGRVTALKAVAAELDRSVILVDGRLLALAEPYEADAALRAILFEAEIYSELVCIQDASEIVQPTSRLASVLAAELRRRHAAVALCLGVEDQVDVALDEVVVLRRELQLSVADHAINRLWRFNTPEAHVLVDKLDFKHLTDAINLTPLQIQKATTLSYFLGDEAPEPAEDGSPRVRFTERLLADAAKSQISRSIGTLAVVAEPELMLSDLVLDDETLRTIQEIISAARNRRMVLQDWGIGQRVRRGTGIITLFDGDPGTGKTHTAEVVAGELGLSLVRVNIAGIVDKYIGETEKKLTQIFEHVRSDLSLLLFDEADSLFSKRSADVSRSTDRYSNMEINVLLQLVERYEGITILTTNLKRAIDPAFERRFTYKVHFKRPDELQRERIWRYLLPDTVPTAETIRFPDLAEVELSGGEIKNAILLACYRAAHEGSRLTNHHLHDAAQREAASSGRVVRWEMPDDDES